VYVNCANNNRGSTVYDLFLGAVQQYGLPSRLRCDQGGENRLVALHMLHRRGEKKCDCWELSTQCVERFWRDMHRCVTQLFYRLFYYMEHHAILDPTSNLHLFALHYVYKPRINEGLKHFQSAWNNHPMRTEHGHSPVQLFTAGALRLQRSGMAAVDFFDDISDDYGADEQGLATEEDNASRARPPIWGAFEDDRMLTYLCWRCQQNSTAIVRSANISETEKSEVSILSLKQNWIVTCLFSHHSKGMPVAPNTPLYIQYAT